MKEEFKILDRADTFKYVTTLPQEQKQIILTELLYKQQHILRKQPQQTVAEILIDFKTISK